MSALQVCKPHIQQKMVEYFTNADPKYGKRVSDGLAQANQNRENHTSYEASDQAVDKSKQMGHEADPY